jgi:hypothetical protein
MLRDCRTVRSEIRSDLPSAAPGLKQKPQDLSAGRIGNRPEHRVALFALQCNYMVTNVAPPDSASEATPETGL